MSDVTDLGPMIALAKLRMKNKKEYDELMKEVRLVTKDMIEISVSLMKEQKENLENAVQ